MGRFCQWIQIAALPVGLSLFGCASQGPPSGGPPDRTPPYVVSSVPASDSVSVATDTTIEVLFSEAMDRQSVERSVFVSPTPTTSPRLRWKGRRLRIQLAGGLAADRTYRVSVGADGQDENRNRMTSSYDFTFSTGTVISRGVVSGKVRSAPGQTTTVAAYDLSETSNPDPAVRAPYVTQSGEHGDYRFPGLGAGRYRVFAIGDRNQDQVLDRSTELLGIASRDALLETDTSTVVLADVKLTGRDTAGARPVTARTVDNRRIRVKMDKPARLPLDVGIDGTSGVLKVESAYLAALDSSVVFLVTEPQAEGEAYRVTVRFSGRDTTLEVKGDGRADRRAPRIASVGPAAGKSVSVHTTIVLTFDEAMRPDSVRALWAVSDSTSSPPGKVDWTSPNTLTFSPAVPFEEGDVLLRLDPSVLFDVSGNPADEAVEVAFKAVGESSLGSVTGGLLPQADAVRVEMVDLDRDGGVTTLRVSPGDTTFVVDGLLPGRFVLQAYVDVNDDGVWGAGSVSPFSFSEPLLVPVDTVEVRPRWETVADARFARHPLPVKPGSEGRVP